VPVLLDAGADTMIEDTQFHAKPAGWLDHGSRFCEDGAGQYAAALQALLDAGIALPRVESPTGRADLDALLRKRGLLE
jgi:hypothetical protein